MRFVRPSLLFALSLAAAPVQAAPSNRAEAQVHYKKGVVAYTIGHFPEAIVEFEQAYELDNNPRLLFNIAQSHRHAEHYERAIFVFKQYLELAPHAKNVPEVQRYIQELEDLLYQQRLKARHPPTSSSPPTAAAPPPPPPPKSSDKAPPPEPEKPAPDDAVMDRAHPARAGLRR